MVFAINILDESKKDLAIHFGRQSGREVDKFVEIEYRTEESGSPILHRDAIAYVDCRVVETLEAGDHTIFMGKVLKAETIRQKDPLVYNRKDYPQ